MSNLTTDCRESGKTFVAHLIEFHVFVHVFRQVELYRKRDVFGVSHAFFLFLTGLAHSLHEVCLGGQSLVEAVHEDHAAVRQFRTVIHHHDLWIHPAEITGRLLPLLVFPQDPLQRCILGGCTAICVFFDTSYYIGKFTVKWTINWSFKMKYFVYHCQYFHCRTNCKLHSNKLE